MAGGGCSRGTRACGDHCLHISLLRTLAQWHVVVVIFGQQHVSSRPEKKTQKMSKIIFPWESDSDKNGQSKTRGSHPRHSYAGVWSAILAQVALGPLVKLWPTGSIPGGLPILPCDFGPGKRHREFI